MSLKMFSEKKSKERLSSLVILAVAAGKGGVGKSFVTVNLAYALQRAGRKVAILDADLYGPSVPRMMKEERPVQRKGEKWIPALCQGIRVISMGFFQKQQEAAAMRAPMASRVIMRFLNDVDWGDVDYLLVDFPPGTGDVQLTLAQGVKFSGALMVTTPQELAVADVRRAIDLFRQVRVPIIGVVENLSVFYHPSTGEAISLFGSGGGRRLAGEMQLPFLCSIPLDPLLCRCADTGQSPFELPQTEKSKTIEALLELADEIDRRFSQKNKRDSSDLVAIEQIFPVDRSTFGIAWKDGKTAHYNLRDLQRLCPCAACEEKRRTPSKEEPIEDVRAESVQSVGGYAVKVQFTTGCVHGIYTYDLLRNLAEKQ